MHPCATFGLHPVVKFDRAERDRTECNGGFVFVQVILLLYISQWMVHFIWSLGDDPDNVAIPYLTAVGDLLGTAFLALAFHVLYLIGDRDADLGE